MKHSETVMVRVGKQERAVNVSVELDLQALAKKAMQSMGQKLEALDGAVKCQVKVFGR